MTSTGVNVLRWGALVAGVFYGFSHQSAISARDKVAAQQREYERKEKLIERAKEEWQKKQSPNLFSSSGNGVITNPDDPKFDLEAYLKNMEKTSP